jgi:hypothetical protein
MKHYLDDLDPQHYANRFVAGLRNVGYDVPPGDVQIRRDDAHRISVNVKDEDLLGGKMRKHCIVTGMIYVGSLMLGDVFRHVSREELDARALRDFRRSIGNVSLHMCIESGGHRVEYDINPDQVFSED